MANNPPELAQKGPNASVSINFRRGRRPKPREFPVDQDRDKKIAEFLKAREKVNE